MADGAATKGDSTSADKETNRPSREKEGMPSLSSLVLVREATTPYNILSMDIEDWRRAVYEGVFLKKDKQAKSHFPFNSIYLSFSDNCKMCDQKFWVDEKLHKNCFLVYPEACDIAGRDEGSCWYWTTMKENCFDGYVYIRLPESKELSWLLIRGRFETRALSPNTRYEVAFLVKLNRTDSGGHSSVTLKLHLPDGTKLDNTERLRSEPQEEWINLRAGEFVMGPKTVGTISFALKGTLNPQMTGLILKGVLINPKD